MIDPACQLINNTSVDDLRSSLRCARDNGRPVSLDRLKASLEDERRSGWRKSVMELIEREIRRHEKEK